jgi:eukaryotic-like serine/threonine-protein kinase
MATRTHHADDKELKILLSANEGSSEYRNAAAHVESCPACSQRLEQLAGSQEIDQRTRDLLSDYPWNELSASRSDRGDGYDSSAITSALDFLSPASHPELLGRLGRYHVERVIGSGGMGVVLKAFDSELNRPVAIKVLAQHLRSNGAARQRFARESKAAAAIVHEHVVGIHNVEADGDVPFIVMQYVAGESLQARVDDGGPLGMNELLRIGIQAAAGLAAAHEQGVVHRDVKPANILLEMSVERVLLTDFGLARTVDDASLTQTGVVAGTPHYMTPEQANGDPTDHRTDLFSLGSVLYFMATGHPPFRAERAMGALNRICHHRQRPLWQLVTDMPDELSVLVDRLLEKQPAKRISSAADVREQLTKILAQLQQPRIGFTRHVRRFALRYPKRLVAGLLFTTAALGFMLAMAFPRTTQRDESRVVDDQATAAAATSPIATVATLGSSADVLLVVDSIEAEQFETMMDQLRNRLDALSAGDVYRFTSDSVDPFTDSLQSLPQRLNRLQGEFRSESHSNQTGDSK